MIQAVEKASDALRILVVEDELIVAHDLMHSLRRRGFQTLGPSVSAEDAVEKCRELGPDVVLMDIMLKGERDGVDAARQITEQQGVPVVYVTASSEDVTYKRAMSTDPLGFVRKPIDFEHLESILDTLAESIRR